MDLRQVLGLEQRMELRQELQLTLSQKLILYAPEEFQRYIKIENEIDTDLFFHSLPFLVFHEFSHPLATKGKLVIPCPYPSGHNGFETGIDKGGMLLGSLIGRYTPEQMYQSHAAMMERVFRDHFELKKFPTELSFLARLYVEIQNHREKTMDEILQKKLERLIKQADRYITEKSQQESALRSHFESMTREYADIYKDTSFSFS